MLASFSTKCITHILFVTSLIIFIYIITVGHQEEWLKQDTPYAVQASFVCSFLLLNSVLLERRQRFTDIRNEGRDFIHTETTYRGQKEQKDITW